MKHVNILSLVQAYCSLDEEQYAKYLNHYAIEIRNEEVEDIKSLIDILYAQTSNRNIFNGFFVGYKIPQIGKEFDLLRFGNDCVINLEIKSICVLEKLKKQLKRNKYYLSYIGNTLYNLTYVSSTQQLYFLDNDENLEVVDFSFLEELLNKQKINYIDNADELFNPSDYLVSPFNSTNKFLENKYFLTSQQESIRHQIIQSINKREKHTFISVTGSAGTGKTLLIYDIVKNIKSKKKNSLMIHCGYLNDGHKTLSENGWNIISIKGAQKYDLSKYDVVIIDEAQRIYVEQLEIIVDKIKSTNGCCILSYDKLQTLAKWEEKRDIDAKINDIDSIVKYTLSEKIRTNKEIATFIKLLFNDKKNYDLTNKGNIELNYFNNPEDAKNYLETLDALDWEVIRFTPSQYNKEHHEKYSDDANKSSHNVIGQEFDGVAVTIDQYFSYNESGDLIYKGAAYYHPVKMLFQNITRTREKLNLVIINNHTILNRCLSILQN